MRNEEIHELHTSPSIIKLIKSRKVRWAGHMAQTGENINSYSPFIGKSKGKGTTRDTWACLG
jgi:hypothetical protein